MILPVVGEEEILEAVVVVVAHADALRPAGAEQAGLGGHVGEGAVAVVFVEVVAGFWRSVFETPSAGDEDVHPAVVVVVEEGAAGGHGFDDVGEAVGLAIDHRCGQAGCVGNIDKAGKRRNGL